MIGAAIPSFAATLLESNTDPEKEELIKMTSASLYGGMHSSHLQSVSSALRINLSGGADTVSLQYEEADDRD